MEAGGHRARARVGPAPLTSLDNNQCKSREPGKTGLLSFDKPFSSFPVVEFQRKPMELVSRKLQVTILILFAAGLAGCYETRSRVTQTVDKTWDATELKSLDLETVNGRVEVVRGDTDRVRLKAEIRSSHETNQDVLRFKTSGDVLEVRESWSRARRGIFPFNDSSQSVRYEIEVPASFSLDLNTTNGRIETAGIRGFQSIASVNGRIEIDTPDAEISARTVNGRIEARFHEAFHGAKLKTVNGSVKVYVPAGTRVAADIDQVNGSFNSRLPVVVNARGSSDGVPLRVTTVNGSVTLDEIGPREVETPVEIEPEEL